MTNTKARSSAIQLGRLMRLRPDRPSTTRERRVPLFLTPHSLSSKTAFGVQTKLLLEQASDYIHAYWYSPEIGNVDERSIRLESLLFSRFSIFKRDRASRLARTLAWLGLSWWDGNTLKAHKKQQLRKRFAEQVVVVYAAPSETRDCERMRDILTMLGKPFILHIWDVLDEGQADSTAFRWLLEHATHVLCVSDAMVRHFAPIRPDARTLSFARKQSPYRAQPPCSQPLRIMLIGYCPPYISGLKTLNDALYFLEQRGQRVELVYIGTKKAANQWSHHFDQEVLATGFVSSDKDKDEILSSGHIGFLPGPLNPPTKDARSRLSIPSRVLDFLAAGLPLVATVHEDSATATYLRKLGLGDCIFDACAERLAEKILALANPTVWQRQSDASDAAFTFSCRARSVLKELLENTR